MLVWWRVVRWGVWWGEAPQHRVEDVLLLVRLALLALGLLFVDNLCDNLLIYSAGINWVGIYVCVSVRFRDFLL